MDVKHNKSIMVISFLIFVFIILAGFEAHAAPTDFPIPNINVSVDNASTPQQYVGTIKLLIVLTVLTLLPSFIMMMTSFVRIIVVFGFLRSAMGTQQSPPNQVLVGLALFMTIFIMLPVYGKINSTAIQPYLNNRITHQTASLGAVRRRFLDSRLV